MTYDLNKIAAIVDQAVAEGADQSTVKAGGGDYTPPAAGATRLRFIGYIEIGVQKSVYKGVEKKAKKAHFIFELSGPKHQPRVNEDGSKTPLRISFTESISQSEKANFPKLFKRLQDGDNLVKHVAQALGRAYRGTVVHDKWTPADSKEEKVTAKLRDETGYTITSTKYEDPETGEPRQVQVDPVISPIRCFLWDYADKEMWDSIFIDGKYDDVVDEKTGDVKRVGRSKNKLQELVMSAENWKGSPMQQILAANGEEPDLPKSERPARAEVPEGDDADDALNAASATPVGRTPNGTAPGKSAAADAASLGGNVDDDVPY